MSLKGYLTPDGRYYEATVPAQLADREIPKKPEEGDYFFHVKSKEWRVGRRVHIRKPETYTPINLVDAGSELTCVLPGKPCPTHKDKSACTESHRAMCEEQVLKDSLERDAEKGKSEYTKYDINRHVWSIKEILSLLITVIGALGTMTYNVVSVWDEQIKTVAVLETEVARLKEDISVVKAENASIDSKLDTFSASFGELQEFMRNVMVIIEKEKADREKKERERESAGGKR